MKKRMIIGGIGLVTLMPLVTVSCKFFGLNVSEIITGGPSHTTPPEKIPIIKIHLMKMNKRLYLPNLHIMARLIQLIEKIY